MAKKAQEEKTGFEVYLKDIEKIVDELESGELSLDDAIARYEKGMALAEKCEKSLKEAKMKIELVKKKTAKGLETENFEEEDGEEQEDEDEDKEDGDDNGGKLF
ncbi:MAG TPA: exodeoxyribonuclease VII small subunit [Candidatus Goldiibacteriota bacterium]|nr:exodeoxyribonuclease VII small subunit [Candidatus Goldiibacteriota bacterium]HRQ44241.1 exodeoxyribonuclease VII small subunit [Candidatus Goldiibacteriota bacterium]